MAGHRVEQTAQGPMVITAIEQFEPIGRRIEDDPLAQRMLPTALRAAVGVCRVSGLRRLMINASERSIPGSWGALLARKRYGDDQVRQALEAGIGQVVFLGAGFDTRSARLVLPAEATAYEIDLPANVTAKRQRLTRVLGDLPDRIRLVEIDFGTDDLMATLTGAGFDSAAPALFVWEAVTQYLDEAAVQATLAALGKAAVGSRLIFTYVLKELIEGTDLHDAEGLYRRFVIKHPIWHFGLDQDEVEPLLKPYGWSVCEDVGPAEYAERYFRPAGRELTAMSIERFVRADKIN
jgi:methyltransferase (TIGR00027 family)